MNTTIKVIFLALNERTAGGWIVGTRAAKRLVKDFNEHLDKRWFVTLEGEDKLEDVCGHLLEPGLMLENNKIIGYVELLHTTKGKIANECICGGLPLYGDIGIVVNHIGKDIKGSDFKGFSYCVLTGNPGITSKCKHPVTIVEDLQ